ncbi:MAG TPA: gas vesicle protein K [Candidatus Nitrosotalea sp.]|nr:gas vesicle protein K [Candidatus Nitrosotalea sp.]
MKQKIIRPKNMTTQQVNLDGENLQKGLAKLVLVIIELLRQVLEKQAKRRISSGTLTKAEIERLGLAFKQIKQTITDISDQFGFSPQEFDIRLNQTNNKLAGTSSQATLVDVVDHLLDKGVLLGGQVKISVADIDLVILDLLGVLSAVHGVKKSSRRRNRSR